MNEQLFDQWEIEYDSGIPAFRQIINHIAAAVAAGAFQKGEQLPTIRALHEKLKVNPNTVAKAYRELELKGIIESERGSGSFVKAEPVRAGASVRKKRERVKSLYHRLLAEAASQGVTERELVMYMKERNV